MHELAHFSCGYGHECKNDDCVRMATNARIIILRGWQRTHELAYCGVGTNTLIKALFAINFTTTPSLHHAFPIGFIAWFTFEDVQVIGPGTFELSEIK